MLFGGRGSKKEILTQNRGGGRTSRKSGQSYRLQKKKKKKEQKTLVERTLQVIGGLGGPGRGRVGHQFLGAAIRRQNGRSRKRKPEVHGKVITAAVKGIVREKKTIRYSGMNT